MAVPALLAKAAASILTNEKSRKAVGWVLTAVLSPIILLLAFFCTTFSGGAEHNRTVVDLCFHSGAVPEGTPAEYQAYIQEMRDSFALLDAAMQTVEGQMEDGDSLDDVRVKAVFFALYFGADDPALPPGTNRGAEAVRPDEGHVGAGDPALRSSGHAIFHNVVDAVRIGLLLRSDLCSGKLSDLLISLLEV